MGVQISCCAYSVSLCKTFLFVYDDFGNCTSYTGGEKGELDRGGIFKSGSVFVLISTPPVACCISALRVAQVHESNLFASGYGARKKMCVE